MQTKSRFLLLAPLVLPLFNCVAASDDDVSSVESPLNGSFTTASVFQTRRAVVPEFGQATGPACTATKIAPHWLLTAGRCSFPAGSAVRFYGSSSSPPFGFNANVVTKVQPSGAAAPGDTTDIYGGFADIALVQIDREDQFGAIAPLAVRYPGSNAAGQKVGAGRTGDSDTINQFGTLNQVGDTTSSSDDLDGSFKTANRRWNEGDQGGPFYVGGRVLGVLDDSVLTSARYTSVPHHLSWILSTINYKWSGSPTTGGGLTGSTLEQFDVDGPTVCEYACDTRSDCQGFTYIPTQWTQNPPTPPQCRLVTGVTGAGSAPDGSISALHFAGARQSRSGTVVGMIGGDGLESVFHVSSAGHLKELSNTIGPDAGWNDFNLPNQYPVTGKLSVYKRADGISSVLYRSVTKLIEVAHVNGTWTAFEMPQLSGTVIAGDPVGYVRADGVSAVVYRTWENHLVELSLTNRVPAGWEVKDLTATVPGTPIADSDPSAFVRADGFSSIVFRCHGTSVCELFHSAESHTWAVGEPFALANAGAFPAAGRPSGYSHHDGTTAIAYRTTSNEIKELWLDGLGWHVGDIMGPTGHRGPLASGDPTAYVRADGLEAVVYRSGNSVYELANWGFWQGNSLMYDNASAALSDPVPYIRSQAWSSVVYNTQSTTAAELALHDGWNFTNLSYAAFEAP